MLAIARRIRAKSAIIGALLVVGSAALIFFTARGLRYWLPPDYSRHGRAIDLIFYFIFWLTFVVFIAVEALLVWFMIRYRRRPGQVKAIFIHGNTRLEMIWTLIPAGIFLVIAMWSRQIWDNYRYSPLADDPNLARILVIGQQFKWNVVYPGPDGKLGRYLLYPKVTDLAWPRLPPGASFNFPAEYLGPAYMPEQKAQQILDQYISQVNPLGKDFDDPDGKDDLWQGSIRPLEIPKGRAVEIQLSSRDVIHDFYVPDLRVKLDAVPGMRGRLYFKATTSTAELEKASLCPYTLDEIEAGLKANRSYTLVITDQDKQSGKVDHKIDRRHHLDYWRFADKSGETIVRDGAPITPDVPPALRSIGVNSVTAYEAKYFELVCEQLCGAGHYQMQDNVIVIEDDEYRKKYETPVATVEAPAPALARR